MFITKQLLFKWLESDRLTIQPQRCVKNKNRFASCTRCFDTCPTPAISLENGLHVNREACNECMKCTTVCPTEVFVDENYYDFFVEIPKREIVSFACEKVNEKETEQHIKLSCLQQIDMNLLLYATMHSNEINIQYDQEQCMKCSKYCGTFEESLQIKIKLLKEMTNKNVQISYCLEGYNKMEKLYSRRDLFHFFSGKVTRHVVTPLIEDKPLLPNLRVGMDKGLYKNMTKAIVKKYDNQLKEEQRCETLNTMTLAITNQCDGCGLCANVCPTSAITILDGDNELNIRQQVSLCNGCFSCIDICPNKAISVGASMIKLTSYLNDQIVELNKLYKKPCVKCGEKHTNMNDYCPDCQLYQKRTKHLSFS